MDCREKCNPGADLQLVVLSRQGVEVSSLSAAVSHFLCCLLVPHYTPTPGGEEAKKKSRRRGRAGAPDSSPWSTLTGAELWNLVCQDSVETYNISDCLGWEHSLCLFSTHICFWKKKCSRLLFGFLSQLWSKSPGGALRSAENLLASRILFKDWSSGIWPMVYM